VQRLRSISIIGPGFVVVTVAIAVVALVVTVRAGRGRRWLRRFGSLGTLMLVLGSVAATVNAYYGYLPNVAALVGWRAADQASWAEAQAAVVRRRSGVPQLPLKRGKVVQVVIPATRSKFHARPAEVYLPPAWFTVPRARLPVIELLHGSPGTPEDWARSASIDLVADRFAAAHGGLAPIIVMPDINGSFAEDTECVDGPMGNVDTYLAVDVPRWVLGTLDPATPPEAWIVGGASEGGTCAVNLVLAHPERFRTFLDFSGDDRLSRHGGARSLFRGSPVERDAAIERHRPGHLLRSVGHPEQIAGWFESGGADGPARRAALRLAAVARSRGMAVHVSVSAGGRHTWRVWRRCFEDTLPWLAGRTGLLTPKAALTVGP